MQDAVGPRFIYRGNAAPFGARIHSIGNKTRHEVVKGAPSSALGVSGGHAKAEGDGGKYEDIFKWGASLAECVGKVLPNNHRETTVTSSIKDTWAHNKPHVFKATELTITVVSDHPEKGRQPSITSTKPVFGELLLDEKLVDVVYDDYVDFVNLPTFELFEKEYRGNQAFFGKYKKRVGHPAGGKYGDALPRLESGYVSASFVKEVTWDGKTTEGNSLYLEGFGTIYFGEVLMNEYNRRITMVRLAMGSETGADSDQAEADPNGTWGN